MSLANYEQAFGHLCTDGLIDNQPSHGIVFECQVLVMKNKCLQPKNIDNNVQSQFTYMNLGVGVLFTLVTEA